jgi:hypothetical protein
MMITMNPALIPGKPISVWVIEAARESVAFDKVVVNAYYDAFEPVAWTLGTDFYCETYKGNNCPAYRLGPVPIAWDMLTVLDGLKPVRESHIATVFDGRAVAEAFQRLQEP